MCVTLSARCYTTDTQTTTFLLLTHFTPVGNYEKPCKYLGVCENMVIMQYPGVYQNTTVKSDSIHSEFVSNGM